MMRMVPKASLWRESRRILATGLVAVPGGLLFSLLQIPLPWMLGPLVCGLLYRALRDEAARWPVGLRNAGMIVIGYSMGRSFTPETAEQVAINLPWMAAVTLLVLLFSLATGYLTCRATGISLASAVLGSIPGGFAQMILVAEESRDADVTTVMVMQMARVLAVLFIVPFVATYGIDHAPAVVAPAAARGAALALAPLPALLVASFGAFLARWLRVPVPFLLGPVFATIVAVLAGLPAPPIPLPWLNGAQLFFGVYLGVTISLERLLTVGRVLPWAIGGSVALVAFTYLLGLGLTFVTPASLLTTFLSTAPGGITEMGIVAITLGADVAFILAYQLFRLFFVLFAAPLLLRRRFVGGAGPGAQAPPVP